MPSDEAKPLHQCLPDDILLKLKDKIEKQRLLQQAWATQVGADIAEHTQVTGYESGILRVRLQSPAWAARLRQQGASMLKKLRRQPPFEDIKKLQLRVVPHEDAANEINARRLQLSDRSRNLIKTVADGIDDSSLKSAMIRLSQVSDNISKK